MTTLNIWNGDNELIAGGASRGSAITQAQFRSWLATVDLGEPPLVAGAIPYSWRDPVNIAWNGPYVVCGDALTRFAAARLGMTWADFEATWPEIADRRITP